MFGGEWKTPAPPIPLDVMGICAAEPDVAQQHLKDVSWRDKPFQLGRRPFESAESPT